MSKELQVGNLVWAKMKGFSPWPARIAKSKKNKKGYTWIYFFGSNNYAWIEDAQVKPYEKFKAKFENMCKTVPFKQAIEAIEDFIEKRKADPRYDEVFDGLLEAENELVQQQAQKMEQAAATPKKPKKSLVKRQSSDSTPRNSSPKKPRVSSTSPNLNKSDENGTANTTTEDAYEEEILHLPPNLSKPESPKLELPPLSEDLKEKVPPSNLAFGFMGLGNMGSSVVMNLIISGHRVNLWNRTAEKCEAIKTQADLNQPGLVQTYPTPTDVVQNSDIIFSCLSDSKAVKEVVIGNCGVIHGAEGFTALENKAYVEMSSVDPETSKDIQQIITDKGGRYLEAQMHGSKKQAEEGDLIILAAGDRSLFDDCQNCFKAICKSAFHLGPVGSASKMNLCLNMALGISLSGLAESMVLAEKCGLSCKDFLNIYKMSEGASKYTTHKGDLIFNRQFVNVEQALKYMQKDIKMALDISNDVKQNLPVAAAVNETFKTARRSGYDLHDVSIVFMKMRH